jgi:large conductance mechanosensitive channel
MFKEFREFISRGNVIDLAIGVIIGGAFGAIVKSLTDQVIMPPIGLLIGGLDFSAMKLVLKPALAGKSEVAIAYGAFINSIVTFLIIAFVLFLLVRAVNQLRREKAAEPAAEAPPSPTATEALLTEIRDLLKTRP